MSKKFVNESEESITKYFKEVRKSEVLTPEAEVDLAIKIKNGDKKALDKLVQSNLKFVVSIAKEYQGQGMQLSDLINDGNEGLIKAAYRFDHTKGFKFISYAVWWIKQSIIQSLNDNSRMVRLPANIVAKQAQIKKQIEKFELENERLPISGDILKSEEEYEEVIHPTMVSLNTVINEDGDELLDLIEDNSLGRPDDNILKNDELRKELNKTLDELEERERDILECYFGLKEGYEAMTLEAIGDRYNLTKERIRQIKYKAVRKLRHNIHNLMKIRNI